MVVSPVTLLGQLAAMLSGLTQEVLWFWVDAARGLGHVHLADVGLNRF
jgi:hypothetical protein